VQILTEKPDVSEPLVSSIPSPSNHIFLLQKFAPIPVEYNTETTHVMPALRLPLTCNALLLTRPADPYEPWPDRGG